MAESPLGVAIEIVFKPTVEKSTARVKRMSIARLICQIWDWATETDTTVKPLAPVELEPLSDPDPVTEPPQPAAMSGRARRRENKDLFTRIAWMGDMFFLGRGTQASVE